jgi:hypothetical protein
MHVNTWKSVVCLFICCGTNAFRMVCSNSSLIPKFCACAYTDFLVVCGLYLQSCNISVEYIGSQPLPALGSVRDLFHRPALSQISVGHLPTSTLNAHHPSECLQSTHVLFQGIIPAFALGGPEENPENRIVTISAEVLTGHPSDSSDKNQLAR